MMATAQPVTIDLMRRQLQDQLRAQQEEERGQLPAFRQFATLGRNTGIETSSGNFDLLASRPGALSSIITGDHPLIQQLMRDGAANVDTAELEAFSDKMRNMIHTLSDPNFSFLDSGRRQETTRQRWARAFRNAANPGRRTRDRAEDQAAKFRLISQLAPQYMAAQKELGLRNNSELIRSVQGKAVDALIEELTRDMQRRGFSKFKEALIAGGMPEDQAHVTALHMTGTPDSLIKEAPDAPVTRALEVFRYLQEHQPELATEERRRALVNEAMGLPEDFGMTTSKDTADAVDSYISSRKAGAPQEVAGLHFTKDQRKEIGDAALAKIDAEVDAEIEAERAKEERAARFDSLKFHKEWRELVEKRWKESRITRAELARRSGAPLEPTSFRESGEAPYTDKEGILQPFSPESRTNIFDPNEVIQDPEFTRDHAVIEVGKRWITLEELNKNPKAELIAAIELQMAPSLEKLKQLESYRAKRDLEYYKRLRRRRLGELSGAEAE